VKNRPQSKVAVTKLYASHAVGLNVLTQIVCAIYTSNRKNSLSTPPSTHPWPVVTTTDYDNIVSAPRIWLTTPLKLHFRLKPGQRWALRVLGCRFCRTPRVGASGVVNDENNRKNMHSVFRNDELIRLEKKKSPPYEMCACVRASRLICSCPRRRQEARG